MSRALVAAAALACASTTAHAGAGSFWAPPASERPEPSEFQRLVALGDQLAATTLEYWVQGTELLRQDLRESRLRYAMARRWAGRAVTAYEDALKLEPDHAELHYRTAALLHEHFYRYYDDDVPMLAQRDEIGRRVIAHWDAYERLAPRDPRRLDFTRDAGRRPVVGLLGFAPLPFQFERSIVFTKLGGQDDYERALRDYDYLLSVVHRNDLTSSWVAQVLTNSAEILMAMGRIDEAVERYRQGVEHENRALYLYGLAVAMDRAGFGETALQLMRDGAVIDRFNALGELTSDTVFFIPEGEVFYYQALGFEALGNLAEARDQYELFLKVATGSRYRERAREHLQLLGTPTRAQRQSTWKTRRP